MKLNVAYFGTPDFSAHFLEEIIKDKTLPVEVKLVVTQPDKPVGRKQILTASPVKMVAKKYGINIYDNTIVGIDPRVDPKKGRHTGLPLPNLLTQNQIDLCLLFAYRGVIPPEILKIPKYGFWNVHPSLLPKFRGPSPTIYPIVLGLGETGTSLIKMDNKIDHGPIISQKKLKIPPKIKNSELIFLLTNLSLTLFKDSLQSFILSEQSFTNQDDTQTTYTRQLKKQDGYLPRSSLKKTTVGEPLLFEELPQILREFIKKYPHEEFPQINAIKNGHFAQIIFDYFRALLPWPGLWTTVEIAGQEKRLKIIDMDLINGKLIIKKVQLEGKKEVNFNQFNKAYRIFPPLEHLL